MVQPTKLSVWRREFIAEALRNAVRKLHPKTQWHNPVMFCVEVGAGLITVLFLVRLFQSRSRVVGFDLQIAIWLWLTVLFANFAEALAEVRGKAQSESLRSLKKNLTAKRLASRDRQSVSVVPASELKKGDLVLVEAGDLIPGDGEVIEGVALVDESAVTGESAPVIRESGGDRSAVTGGTKVLSDWIVVRVGADPGETFLDKMIALVEGAIRSKTPNEIALNILLILLTLIFVFATATIEPFLRFYGGTSSVTQLVSLFVALAPTTIGALLSAIGIAGMNRLLQINVLAFSGRAVEASGDVDTVLLDKTGTITLGNRYAVEFIPSPGQDERRLAEASQLASLSDQTPEGRSIVVLAKQRFGIREHRFGTQDQVQFVEFTAQSRLSGVDFDGRKIRKGATDAIAAFVRTVRSDAEIDRPTLAVVDGIAKAGGTPLVVAENESVLGVIHLKDVLKGGISERIRSLHGMGIRSVMITGDNPVTAAAIAAEAGVADFVSEARPEDKLSLIRRYQSEGHMVAMIGDGTNDAPALAQADVGIAMNTGTSAAREAGNMLDLDSNPTKLIEVVEIGKQILITRGTLTTFSIANDIAKYFAILPALFVPFFPSLQVLNIMKLASSPSAILSAIIFNAIIIPSLIPVALRGAKYVPKSASTLLRRNLLIYGLGGVALPFVGIKLIDILVNFMGLVGRT
jgi:K+-transporting ATPase ATPase B chain